MTSLNVHPKNIGDYFEWRVGAARQCIASGVLYMCVVDEEDRRKELIWHRHFFRLSNKGALAYYPASHISFDEEKRSRDSLSDFGTPYKDLLFPSSSEIDAHGSAESQIGEIDFNDIGRIQIKQYNPQSNFLKNLSQYEQFASLSEMDEITCIQLRAATKVFCLTAHSTPQVREWAFQFHTMVVSTSLAETKRTRAANASAEMTEDRRMSFVARPMTPRGVSMRNTQKQRSWDELQDKTFVDSVSELGLARSPSGMSEFTVNQSSPTMEDPESLHFEEEFSIDDTLLQNMRSVDMRRYSTRSLSTLNSPSSTHHEGTESSVFRVPTRDFEDRRLNNPDFEADSDHGDEKDAVYGTEIHPTLAALPSLSKGFNSPDSQFLFGRCAELGLRRKMEDFDIAISDLFLTDESMGGDLYRFSCYGIFDGHSGVRAAEFVKAQLPGKLRHRRNLFHKWPRGAEQAVSEAFREIDKEFLVLASSQVPTWADGSCAILALMRTNLNRKSGDKQSIVVASLGDSKGVIVKRKDVFPTFEAVSLDSSPNDPEERKRIEDIGGWITSEKELFLDRARHIDVSDEFVRRRAKRKLDFVEIYRVNGDIAVSRAFGDIDLKSPFHNNYSFWSYPKDHPGKEPGFKFEARDLVSAEPQFVFREIDFANDSFLVLACDGLFDVLDGSDVAELVVSEYYDKGERDLNSIASRLVDVALKMGSTDNVSCLVIPLAGV